MRIACVAFTRAGVALARRLASLLSQEGDVVDVSCPARLAYDEGVHAVWHLSTWVANAFGEVDALLFVGACGIAVRAIAPFVKDKLADPAVVCVDEGGSFAIPLLSGHVGGANRLARRVARACGAQAAVTTATDVRDVFAVDEWATRLGLAMLDRDEAKRVSATLLDGGTVGIASDVPLEELFDELPDGVVPAAGPAAPTSDPADPSSDPAAPSSDPADPSSDPADPSSDRMERFPEPPEVGISISIDAGKRPFPHTLRLVPRTVVVGVGCKRGTSASRILSLVDACMAEARVAPEAVCAIATIDAKANEPGLREAAHARSWDLRFYDAERLAKVPGEFSSSAFVLQTVGVDNVCERAACAAGGTLLLRRRSSEGVTVALAAEPWSTHASPSRPKAAHAAHLACVGIGPGGADDMTLRAHAALEQAEVIVGYTTYVDLVRTSFPHAEFVSTPMRREVERCRLALERARTGARVAMVCSGDPGVYGMAGLLLELAQEYPDVEVEVVPGVSAANGGAALLGAPLMHDWCSVSLSDLMTPWETIAARLHAAAQADLCICLYNPASRTRRDHLRHACDVLLEHRSPQTACGIARNVGRVGEMCTTLTLAELRDAQVDMQTCVFVGNSQTRIINGRMVTPRGYRHGEG